MHYLIETINLDESSNKFSLYLSYVRIQFSTVYFIFMIQQTKEFPPGQLHCRLYFGAVKRLVMT